MAWTRYLFVEPKDAVRAKKILEESIANTGLKIEEYPARVDESFGEGMTEHNLGQKKVFFCTSDSTKFYLGINEGSRLNNEGILCGMCAYDDGIVKNATESGFSKNKKA
jgi:hypothetical protein